MTNSVFQCYTCIFCDLKFKTSSDLDLHNQLHTDSGDFSCPLCKETFVDLTKLQLHDLQHSLEEIKKVKRYPSTINIACIQPTSSFVCKICNKVFLSDEELFDHITQHTVTENIVNRSPFNSSDGYETEKDVKPPITHTIYKKPYKVNLNQTVKLLRSDVDSPYECKSCKRIFNGPSSLNRHQRRFHLNKEKYMCTACPKTFVNLSLLCEHSLQHCETRRQEFECCICKKYFSSSMLLLEHIFISHVCHNKHFCLACFKFFSNKDDLISHMETHIAAYNCNKCKKWYKTKSKINNHRCVFNGSRPYPCKICNKRFSRLYHLQRHCHMHDKELGVSKVMGVDSELFAKQTLIDNSNSENDAEGKLINLKNI